MSGHDDRDAHEFQFVCVSGLQFVFHFSLFLVVFHIAFFVEV